MKRTELASAFCALAAVAALLACSRETLGPPRPTALEPATGYDSVAREVIIRGGAFWAETEQRLDGATRVDARFRARLAGVALEAVSRVDASTLRARVPAGIPPGRHDLVVEGPYGEGILRDAWESVAGAPGALATTVAAPANVSVGQTLVVVATVVNGGGATVRGVSADVTLGGDAVLALVASDAAPVDVAPGGSARFSFTYAASAPGEARVSVTTAGEDPLDGARIVGNEATATVAVAWEPAPPTPVELAFDPFQDGTSFAHVAGYRGQVWLGPNRDGTRLARLNPDGSGREVLPFTIHRDIVDTGRKHRNKVWSVNGASGTYGSLGFPDCNPDSSISPCGPDNDDGRGLFTSLVVNGEEWLVAGAGRSGGEVGYVYLTRDPAPALAFSYVDVSARLGAKTSGFSAAQAIGGRVYLGFPDDGGSRPYGVALNVLPSPPGLDVSTTAQAVDLQLHDAFAVTGTGLSSTSLVDAFAELNDRLYVFNQGGCLAAKTATPVSRADFANCSPSSSSYVGSASLSPSGLANLEPREKAWPQVAAWNGRLYAIRNTPSVAQLWRCDPAASASGDALVCEPSEWSLAASFSIADDDAVDPRAALLVATPRYLYLGLEYSGGVRLYRADVSPTQPSDFRGRNGCTVGTTGCEGLGGNGLGFSGTRFLDAKGLTFGGETNLYFTVREGSSGPVRLFRITG
jgi:hypothetical protein